MLELKNVVSGYGKTTICKDISIHVNAGEMVAVVGANGAGKTTMIKSIANVTAKKFSGSVIFDGEDITNKKPFEIVERGLIAVEGMESLFTPMSVEENLEISMYPFRKKIDKQKQKEQFDYVYQLFPRLYERKKQASGTLSGGERQMLSLAKALLVDPKMLMLDEPSLGLAPVIIDNIFETIATVVKEKNLTVLIVEQNVDRALQISDRGYVMDVGEIVMENTAQNLLNDKKVMEVYLGIA